MRIPLGFLLNILFFSQLYAQVPPAFSKTQILSYPRDGFGLLKAPLTWGKKECARALVSTAIIYGAYTLDEEVLALVRQEPNNSLATGFLSGSRHWGSGLYSFPVFAGLYFYGKFKDNPRHQLTAMNATKAFVLSRVLVQIPKFLFQRHPPQMLGFAQKSDLDGPLGGGINRSFPSGHVISIFSAAEVFRLSYDNWWVGTLVYTLAGTVALQRIGSGAHWFSDVTTSAVCGAAIGHWLSTKGSTPFSLISGTTAHLNVRTFGLVYNF